MIDSKKVIERIRKTGKPHIQVRFGSTYFMEFNKKTKELAVRHFFSMRHLSIYLNKVLQLKRIEIKGDPIKINWDTKDLSEQQLISQLTAPLEKPNPRIVNGNGHKEKQRVGDFLKIDENKNIKSVWYSLCALYKKYF